MSILTSNDAIIYQILSYTTRLVTMIDTGSVVFLLYTLVFYIDLNCLQVIVNHDMIHGYDTSDFITSDKCFNIFKLYYEYYWLYLFVAKSGSNKEFQALGNF